MFVCYECGHKFKKPDHDPYNGVYLCPKCSSEKIVRINVDVVILDAERLIELVNKAEDNIRCIIGYYNIPHVVELLNYLKEELGYD